MHFTSRGQQRLLLYLKKQQDLAEVPRPTLTIVPASATMPYLHMHMHEEGGSTSLDRFDDLLPAFELLLSIYARNTRVPEEVVTVKSCKGSARLSQSLKALASCAKIKASQGPDALLCPRFVTWISNLPVGSLADRGGFREDQASFAAPLAP